MCDLLLVLFPLPYFVPVLCPDPLCPRFINISTYAIRTYRICNHLTPAPLQVFCNPKKTKTGGEGCEQKALLFSHTHPENFFSKF